VTQGRTCKERSVNETEHSFLNLETLGCPKYDKLGHVIPQEKLLVFLPMTLFIIVLSLNVMLFGSGTKVSLQNMQTSD